MIPEGSLALVLLVFLMAAVGTVVVQKALGWKTTKRMVLFYFVVGWFLIALGNTVNGDPWGFFSGFGVPKWVERTLLFGGY